MKALNIMQTTSYYRNSYAIHGKIYASVQYFGFDV
jgi:hypothetical protein